MLHLTMLFDNMNEMSTILIVDDNPGNLDVLSRQLKEHKMAVLVATKGELAIQRAQHAQPDLILLDVVMPDMDGFEVCRRLKADPSTRNIPVLFITMLTEAADKLKGFEAGGVDYITKPFQSREVLARITAHLTIRRLHRQVQQDADRFRNLAEAAFEGLVIHDGARILEVNQSVVTLFGYPRSELLDRPVLDLFTPDDHAAVLAQFQTRSGDSIHDSQLSIHNSQFSAEELSIVNDELLVDNVEVLGLRWDGQVVLVEIQTRPLGWQGQTLYITALHDLTWRTRLEAENLALHVTLDKREHFGELVGKSAIMHKVYDRLVNAAASDETVIIYGETGTGKELAARTLFALSDRHTARFVPVNCGTLQESLFEPRLFGYRKGAFTGAERNTPGCFDEAQGGMLFLDEVGELSLAMQTTLLRVLNDGTYTPLGADATERRADVRIIAATNRNLRNLVQEGTMRPDFFHRLHVIALEMPPLRLHREDLPLLIRHFLMQRTPAGQELPTIPAALMDRFLTYEWPGNVRELYNELRRYLATGEIELGGVRALEPDAAAPPDLPFLQPTLPLNQAVEAFERYYLTSALQHHQGQRTQAAEALRVDRKTLYNKLKKYNLDQ